MYIYFVRHGQTDFNAKNIFQSAEVPLSLEGEMQAAKVADRLQKIKLDEIWTSPMNRAKQTAEVINQYQKVKTVEHNELREIKIPTRFEGKDKNDLSLNDDAKVFLERKKNDPYYEYEDSETYVQVIKRAREMIQKLEKKANQEKENYALAVTTHGLILNTILLCIMLPKDVNPLHVLYARHHIWHQNTSISVASVFQSEWKIFTIGDFAHL